jgi:transcription antitermination factor NusG
MEETKSCESASVRKRWCILRHSDSDLIGEIFSGKRKVYNPEEDDTHPLPPFEYFIPFADLKQRPREQKDSDVADYKPYDAMLDERALRNDLHHFIFIQVTKEQILGILDAPWVKVLRNRLYVYKDEKGAPIEISDAEMERFKTVIKRYDFQIVNGEPSDDVHEGDQVTVVSGPMAGSDGRVTQIREREGQITLTIEFSMFQNKMCIAVPGVNIADVRLNAPETQQLLQDPVIGHFEDELIELLCHLHGKKGSHKLNKEDQKQLKFLYQYSDIVFEDNPENEAKFAALMLICAYLMDNKEEVDRRLQEVQQLREELVLNSQCPKEEGSSMVNGEKIMVNVQCSMFNGSSTVNDQCSMKEDSKLYTLNSQLEESLDCYLVTALFIATHNPEYRKAAKAWRKNHPDCSLAIRRFLSIAKQIRC